MLLVGCYVIGWVSVFVCFLNLNKHRSAEWNSRMVAFLHAFLACRNIEMNMIKLPFTFEEFGEASTSFQNNAIAFSIAYFIFETCYCLYAQTEDYVMMLHHFISLTGLIWGYQLKVCGYEVCLLLWVAEFTNPILQIRWFLRESGYQKKWYAKVNEFLFVVIFVFFRGVFGFRFSYQVIRSAKLLPVMRYFALAFQVVNCLFLYQISLFAKKRLYGMNTDKEVDVSMQEVEKENIKEK